ncbi:hypothetical protein AAG906_037059 [Vitis piasezkii]
MRTRSLVNQASILSCERTMIEIAIFPFSNTGLALLITTTLTIFVVEYDEGLKKESLPIGMRRNVGGGRLSGMTQQGLLATVNDSDNSSRVSASDIGVVRVTASRTSSLLCQFTLGTFSISAFSSLCLFCGCFWLVGVPVAPLHRLRVTDPALGFRFGPPLENACEKDVASSSAAGQSGRDASGVVYAEKSVDKLNVRQFCERFAFEWHVCSVCGTERSDPLRNVDNAIYFTKDILSMLFNLDLSLLEVLFIYSIKKGKIDLFSLAAYMPSLQLVTHLPDSTKGGAKGHVLVKGTDKRGRVVEWVEKASFDRLNKLFEITAAERHHQTLLTARNLLAVVREPQPYITNILPRRLPKQVVPGEHFVLKDLPFYERARKADAKARQERLDQRDERRQEGTLRKAPCEKGCYSPPAAHPPARKEKKKKKKTKKTLSQVLRIAAPNLEASSSSSLPPEPESAGLQVADKPEEMRSPKSSLGSGWEDPAPKVPAPATTRPDGDRASATDGPGHSSPAMVGTPMPEGVAEVPTGEKAPVERSSYTAAAPPSWEELMVMLKGVPCFTDAKARHPLGISESVTSDIRYMMRSREQLFERLKVAEAMRAYISQHPVALMRLRPVGEGGGEREAIRAEADSLRKEKEALEGQVNEAGQENLQLKREMEELRASLAAQKKESEDLRVWRLKRRRWRLASLHRRRSWRRNTSSRQTRCTSLVTAAV